MSPATLPATPSDYPFKTVPYHHQLTTFLESRNRPSWAYLLEMGCGKSKIAADNAGWLFLEHKIDAVAIVAPKGVYGNWINKEIPVHVPDCILERSLILQWTDKNKTKKFREKLAEFFVPQENMLKWLVINIDAVNTVDGAKVLDAFVARHNTMLILDESTCIKNPKAQWTKRLLKIGKAAKYKRIITGTPITNSPLDAFSQFQLLDERLLGFDSYFAFRNRYAITRRRVISGRSFDEVIGFQRLEELQAKIGKAATILRKDECLDLPDKVYQVREFELSARQQSIYDQLRVLSLAELGSGELVTAELALTKLLRLHQIACGFVRVETGSDDVPVDDDPQRDMFPTHRTADGEIRELDPNGGPRLAELLNCLQETSGKVLIWATYVANIQQIEQALKRDYGPASVATLYGGTPQDIRGETVDRFQNPKDPLRFIVGHPRTGGYGLTLTEAKTVVYFSNNYSLETRLQSEDRAHRIGQTSKVNYVDIVAKGTVDEKIIRALHSKEDLLRGLMHGGWKDILDA